MEHVKQNIKQSKSKDEFIKRVVDTFDTPVNKGKTGFAIASRDAAGTSINSTTVVEDTTDSVNEDIIYSTNPIPWRWLENTVYNKKKPRRFNDEVLEIMNNQARKDVERDTL